MNKAYVEWRDGGYWIANSRVSLDTVVYAFLDGQSPESITQSLPVLTLEQVYGAIAFFLAHRDEIETYLEKAKADFETKRKASQESDPMFYQKLADARRHLGNSSQMRIRFQADADLNQDSTGYNTARTNY